MSLLNSMNQVLSLQKMDTKNVFRGIEEQSTKSVWCKQESTVSLMWCVKP